MALPMEEFRSKYNRDNSAGSSYKTELRSALEDNGCKDIWKQILLLIKLTQMLIILLSAKLICMALISLVVKRSILIVQA